MKKNARSKIFMFSIYTLFVLLATLAAIKANDLSLLNSENSLYISNESFQPDLTMHKLQEANQAIQNYKIQVSREDLSNLKTDTLVFFLNKITDNAYSVKLNGITIGSQGDMEKGQSMFKSSPNHFTFDSKLIEDNNLFEITTYATYKSGLESKGVYITDSHVGMRQARNVDFFGIHLIILGIGFLIFSAVAMIFLYNSNKDREIAFLYCGIATIFIAVYFIDYLKIVYLNHNHLLYKKIFMISLYIAVWFYMLAMSKFLKASFLKYIAAFNALSFIIMSLLVNNFILYKKLYTYWYFALLGNIIIGFIYSLINLKKVRQAFIFVGAFLYSSLYASLAILIELFGSYFSINSPLVFIVIFSSLPLLFGFEELTSKEKQISYEREQRKNEYINSITDNLTGTWNQRFIYNKLDQVIGDVVLAIIDIDDFKQVNDNYGHLAGDFVLKEFCDLAISNIRRTDNLCRYGGDEFIILFYGSDKNQVALTMEKLRKKVEDYNFNFGNQSIKITISVGIYQTVKGQSADKAIKKADKQLYKSKQRGKNNITVY